MYLNVDIHVSEIGSFLLEEGENLAGLLNDVGCRAQVKGVVSFRQSWISELVEQLDDDGKALLGALATRVAAEIVRRDEAQSIHDRFKDQVGLAQIYAEDGAFHSAAHVLRDLATELEAHRKHCDAALEEMMQTGGETDDQA